jgi:hypothetical protein
LLPHQDKDSNKGIMDELGGGDDDNSSSSEIKPPIPDTLIQRGGEDKLLSHDLSCEKGENFTGLSEDENRTNSDQNEPARDQTQSPTYPNNPESPNGANFIASSFENRSNYNSLSNTPNSPQGANFVSLDNSDNQSNVTSPEDAVDLTASTAQLTSSADHKNDSNEIGPNTPPDGFMGAETESKRINFDELFPGAAARLSPPGSFSTPRIGSPADDYEGAYSDSELICNKEEVKGAGDFADDRSLLSLPSMNNSSEDGDTLGELGGAHFSGVPGQWCAF